ncbi:MAG: phosphatidate cytidylyltransferase [Acidobacteria bacterium]|nr:phosphatidate cytidylyltransferase [Acidobacteriota bacterium]
MARVLTAIVFIPILMVALWVGSPLWFVGLTGAAILLGLHEYHSLGRSDGFIPGAVAALLLMYAFYRHELGWIPMVLAAGTVGELIIALWRQRSAEDHTGALPMVAIRLTGTLYVGLLGSYLIGVRMLESTIPSLPAKLLTLFFIVIFAGDTGAYYAGRTVGRRKLAPRISPGKTWEGVVGGLAGNILAALIAHFTFFPELPVLHGVPLALVMGFLGITGDLVESLIKRGASAKDAGHLIPGHGGLLDRLDSMLFNAPVVYYYSIFFLN